MPPNFQIKQPIQGALDYAAQKGEQIQKVQEQYDNLPDFLKNDKVTETFKTAEDYINAVNKWKQETEKAGQTWQSQIEKLKAAGTKGTAELESILQALEKNDIAGAVNKAREFYGTLKDAAKEIENVVRDPKGAAIDIANDMLSFLLVWDLDKRQEAAYRVLKKWFPGLGDGPPAIWLNREGKAVNRTSDNTDYAGRPLPGFTNPYAPLYKWRAPTG